MTSHFEADRGRAPALWALAREAKGASIWTIDQRIYLAGDDRPLGGAMAAVAGGRIASAEIEAGAGLEYADPVEARAAHLIRAWRLPSLEGVSFVVSNSDDIRATLETTLETTLGRHAWAIDPHVLLVFERYGMLHACAPAPIDSTTDQPLEVEILADPTRFVDLDAAQPKPWLELGKTGRERIEFQVVAATCSNVRGLGVGMPFYL